MRLDGREHGGLYGFGRKSSQTATDLDKEVAGPIIGAFYRAEQGAVQPEVRTLSTLDDLDRDPSDDVLLTNNLLALNN